MPQVDHFVTTLFMLNLVFPCFIVTLTAVVSPIISISSGSSSSGISVFIQCVQPGLQVSVVALRLAFKWAGIFNWPLCGGIFLRGWLSSPHGTSSQTFCLFLHVLEKFQMYLAIIISPQAYHLLHSCSSITSPS